MEVQIAQINFKQLFERKNMNMIRLWYSLINTSNIYTIKKIYIHDLKLIEQFI